MEPRIILTTTDSDVAETVARILNGTRPMGPYKPNGIGKKPKWVVQCRGSRAIGWMMTCYPFLGQRRRAKVLGILKIWRSTGTRPNAVARIWSDWSKGD